MSPELIRAIANDLITGCDFITAAAGKMDEPDRTLILNRVQTILAIAQDYCEEMLEA